MLLDITLDQMVSSGTFHLSLACLINHRYISSLRLRAEARRLEYVDARTGCNTEAGRDCKKLVYCEVVVTKESVDFVLYSKSYNGLHMCDNETYLPLRRKLSLARELPTIVSLCRVREYLLAVSLLYEASPATRTSILR